MRKKLLQKFEDKRLRTGEFASEPGVMYGAFVIFGPCGVELKILSSGLDDTTGWEHVSVSVRHRPPNWQEMCFVKDAFWRDDEVVMQLHPSKMDYVNCHPNCLHLWRSLDKEIPVPPSFLVGPKT